jgi:hypothetical protein
MEKHGQTTRLTVSVDGSNPSNSGWWFGTFGLFFHSVGNFIIPTDELIFFRGDETTNQNYSNTD